MAKTRIKNTPTRLQKDASKSAAVAAITTVTTATTTTTSTVDNLKISEKKRVLLPTNAMTATITTPPPKEELQATSTIIVPALKRTNSISSATSTISHASDTHSAHSESESPPLSLPTIASNASKTMLFGTPQSNMLRNRKVFMITEKCEDSQSGELSGAASAQKRKMYLIMEETDAQAADSNMEAAHKYLKIENGAAATATKKLTLYADKCDGEMTQKFEKILPEILSRIQAKGAATKPQNGAGAGPGAKLEPMEEEKALENINANKIKRLPITLPPKKNRIKITTTQSVANTTGSPSNDTTQLKQTSAATPVIVSAASLLNHPPVKATNEQATALAPAQLTTQKNINLSTDFLFLMKMLPKLESIPEPHKYHVRSCIEKIVTQNANVFEK